MGDCEINASDCEEFVGSVNIPKDFAPNSKKEDNVQIKYVERIVYKEKPLVLMIDRATQSDDV